ncbi:MAG TPA: ABC transporter permease [Armatimonadota bacterium]
MSSKAPSESSIEAPSIGGVHPRRPTLGRSEGILALSVASVPLLVLVLLPVGALVGYLRPAQWWEHLRSPMAVEALWLTLRTTAVSTLLCVVLGLPLAYLLARHRFPGREALDTLVDLPITLPPVVVGVALLLAFGRLGVVGRHLDALGIQVGFSTAAVVMAQTVIASPFFVKAARSGFEAADPKLEQAARVLGASWWVAFRKVTLPVARPSLLAGVALAWARALSEFGATITFAGNLPGRTQTLPLAVMSALESDLDTAVAVAGLSLILGLVALFTAKSLARSWSVPGV